MLNDNHKISIQEAANILNVSRPFLIKLLENGDIPFHKVGTERRIFYADLKKFQSAAEEKSIKALEELIQQAQKLNFGY